MAGRKGLKVLLLSIIFCLNVSPLFLLDDIDTIYNIVDVVFEKKSEEGLQKILSENVTNPQYEEIELYVKKKIKKQIIDAEYVFALRASFVLIDCNIDANYDDEEAFVLFTTISNETDD